MRRQTTWVFAASLLAVACGNSSPPPKASNIGYGYELLSRGGVYNDGSGRLGLAVLATLRDAGGSGPASPWSGSIAGPTGVLPATVSYDAAGAGSYLTWTFPDVAPGAGGYSLTLSPGGKDLLQADFGTQGGTGLPLPDVAIAADASSLSWTAVSGAASYACQVSSGGALQLSTLQTTPSCDLSALPDGSYSASVFAFSADLTALASAVQAPSLPDAFDVSESRTAFVKYPPGAGPPVQVQAAGGAYDDGSSQRTLALWVSIAQPDGTATDVSWDVSVTGPGLPADAPFAFTYWANFPRLMKWSYDVPAAAGTYALTATSSLGTVTAPFTVGDPETLALPTGVSASDGAQGSATITWTAVSGAQAYLVSVYDGATGNPWTSQWVPGPSAQFQQGTFVAGNSYDVYVAATDADMVYGAVPTQVSVAENLFNAATFVAR